MELAAVAAIQAGRRAWYPDSYTDLSYQLTHTVTGAFLSSVLPRTTLLPTWVSSISTSLCGLMIGLEQCFAHRGIKEQSSLAWTMFSASPALEAELYADLDPGGQIAGPGITMDSIESFTSPWARHIQEEQFVVEAIELLKQVVADDPTTAQLLTFLLLFTPHGQAIGEEVGFVH